MTKMKLVTANYKWKNQKGKLNRKKESLRIFSKLKIVLRRTVYKLDSLLKNSTPKLHTIEA